MPGHYFHRMRRIIRHCLSAAFLSMVVFTVSVSERMTSASLRMQMIETFTQKGFEALNRSDIDSIMSFVSKSVKKGRPFHYMWKLREAMERETRRFDDLENDSSKDWLIQAFRPAAYHDTSVLFTECALCRKNWQTSRCHVSRVELLVPLIHTDTRAKDNHEWMFVEVNGHALNSSRGTVDISRAMIFDLSAVLLKSDSATQDGALNITIQKHPCRNVFPNRCMLYEYCNINNTILERFREHKSQNEFVESRHYQVNNSNEDVDYNNTNISSNNNNNNSNNNTIENDSKQAPVNVHSETSGEKRPVSDRKCTQKANRGKRVQKSKQYVVSLQQATLTTERVTNEQLYHNRTNSTLADGQNYRNYSDNSALIDHQRYNGSGYSKFAESGERYNDSEYSKFADNEERYFNLSGYSKLPETGERYNGSEYSKLTETGERYNGSEDSKLPENDEGYLNRSGYSKLPETDERYNGSEYLMLAENDEVYDNDSGHSTLRTLRVTDDNEVTSFYSREYVNTSHSLATLSHRHENSSLRTVFSDQTTRKPQKPVVSPETEGKHNQIRKHQQKNKRQAETSAFRGSNSQKNGGSSLESECQRRPFYVSFQRDMNRWDIVIPESRVDIGYCSSSCRHANHFSNVNSRLTAHAVIMNTMWGQSPPVTCSPRKMSSISILKISETGHSLVVENLLNAVVDSCWCT